MSNGSDLRTFEIVTEEGLPVQLPSGSVLYVLTQDEVDYVADRVKRYLTDNSFANISDLQDVDRMVTMEALVHRYSLWLMREKDYFGDAVDANRLRTVVNDWSTEIRQLKKSLGIDKVARDKQRGDDSTVEYLNQLRIRAREFGVMREKQLDRALILFNQMKALITLYRNTDEIEQREMHCSMDDVFDWLESVAIPEFDEIDAHFRQNQQRMWIRKQ